MLSVIEETPLEIDLSQDDSRHTDTETEHITN